MLPTERSFHAWITSNGSSESTCSPIFLIPEMPTKVSNELELSKPAPQLVGNNQ